MTYTLAPPREDRIAVVGCGGTGGFAAEGLVRLGARLLLIDGDRVEERNLGRQNFYPEDLGRFKAQALAERLALKYRVAVGYSVSPLLKEEEGHRGLLSDCGLVVGCVDNAPARAAIAAHVGPHQWWVDAGNGSEFGQVLIGNWSAEDRSETCHSFIPMPGRRTQSGPRAHFNEETQVCDALPLPTLVRPELLVPGLPTHPAPAPGSCAAAVAAGEQGPTINLWMSALVVEAVRLLLEGRLTWWQAYLDLETGGLRLVQATPEGVAAAMGVKLRPQKAQGKTLMEVFNGPRTP